MIRLDVPFIPDENYIRFLNEHTEHIYALHFSLYAPDVADSRHKFRLMETQALAAYLQAVRGPKKYALINSRFHDPRSYAAPDALRAVADRLGILLEASVLDGILWTDAYYLQALSDADGDLASRLEAVPSINCMADSFDKIWAISEAVSGTRFRMPSKCLVDRSLNRNIPRLAEVAARCRKTWPEMKLVLLGNEGCIFQCPFKPAHDAHISLLGMGVSVDTFEMNRTYGCMRYFREKPHKLFKSPFIRPEDVHHYENYADIIKICGRTLGPQFLMKVITAYIRRFFTGNLPELLDTTEWMAHEYDIPNHKLPKDFWDRMTKCPGHCTSCNYCRELYDRHVKALGISIRDLRFNSDS